MEFGFELDSISFLHNKYNGGPINVSGYHHYYYCLQENQLVPVELPKLCEAFYTPLYCLSAIRLKGKDLHTSDKYYSVAHNMCQVNSKF